MVVGGGSWLAATGRREHDLLIPIFIAWLSLCDGEQLNSRWMVQPRPGVDEI